MNGVSFEKHVTYTKLFSGLNAVEALSFVDVPWRLDAILITHPA